MSYLSMFEMWKTIKAEKYAKIYTFLENRLLW